MAKTNTVKLIPKTGKNKIPNSKGSTSIIVSKVKAIISAGKKTEIILIPTTKNVNPNTK